MSNVFTYQEIAEHNSPEDAWIIIDGKVYDVTKFVDEHPGGDEIILELAGQIATEPFNDIGHSDDALKKLEKLLIGRVDVNSEPLNQTEASQSTQTTGGEGSGKLAILCAIVFFAVAYYLSNH
ncbi:hypothetical protein HG535_0A02820 [Zygotorulaspora mrakii]|uniref:Cytochrome b5 heme-binding domain-containing protein n=1 Tax=Zygotorulaspora mrakii TaxID=42260 RepID=A0A7H9AVX7_ZYGMR|nr:uncharacterized protein HG535_0A02820 [Zygotorulaspora mrakii]QLG70343.1 hypothetical protein HG535_0A02820 [Zygotorulaspora mrakii]